MQVLTIATRINHGDSHCVANDVLEPRNAFSPIHVFGDLAGCIYDFAFAILHGLELEDKMNSGGSAGIDLPPDTCPGEVSDGRVVTDAD